jgi:hypothetical protein
MDGLAAMYHAIESAFALWHSGSPIWYHKKEQHMALLQNDTEMNTFSLWWWAVVVTRVDTQDTLCMDLEGLRRSPLGLGHHLEDYRRA